MFALLLACQSAAPPPPPPTRVHGEDDRVVVEAPGEGWDCSPVAERGVVLITCRRSDGFLFMTARQYEVAPEAVQPAEALIHGIFLDNHRKLFTDAEVSDIQPVTHQERAGFTYTVEGTHADRGPILKRERIIVEGVDTWLASAEGDPRMMADHAAAIDRWFSTVQYGPIPRPNP